MQTRHRQEHNFARREFVVAEKGTSAVKSQAGSVRVRQGEKGGEVQDAENRGLVEVLNDQG